VEDLDFNQVEASSAAIGDVLARLQMKQAVAQRPAATDSEVQAAFEQARQKAGVSPGTPVTPGEQEVRRLRKKRTLKTIRGPVEIEREYLYFPALRAGVFPPGPTP
jgi:DNA/RNA-binding domain of Phe-tRNA-synthetase-like protein